MKTRVLLLAMLCLLGLNLLNAQESITVQGRIIDGKTEKSLPEVNIYFPALQKGISSDTKGYFTFQLPKGQHTIEISYTGYQKLVRNIKFDKDTKLAFRLMPSSTLLGEVTITKNYPIAKSVLKMDVPLTQVPVTVSSVDRKLIEQTQSSDINEITQYMTGIRSQKSYGVKQRFVLRGFDQAVVLVDGMRDENFSSDPYATPVTNLSAVERVEFLKGAESVLYGHSAVGGVLNIVRKQPKEEFNANLSTTYGSWNTKKIQAGIGGNITKGLNYLLDASISNTDGWRESKQKMRNAYFALDYQINDKNKVELRTAINNDHYTPDGGMPFVSSDIKDLSGKIIYKKGDVLPNVKHSQRYSNSKDFMGHRNKNIGLKYIHQFSAKTKLSYQFSYADDRTEYLSTGEGLTNPMVTQPDNLHKFMINYYGKPMYADIGKFKQSTIYRHHIHSETLQNYLEFNSKFNTGKLIHNLIIGYTFSTIDRQIYFPAWQAFTGSGAFATVDIINPKRNQGAINSTYWGAQIYKEHTHALYLQDLIEITPKLKAMLGFRSDYFAFKYKMEQTTDGKFRLEDKATPKKFKNYPFSFRGGLVYNPTKNIGIYSSYSTFFKPNRRTYNENYLYFDKEGNEFKPEEGKKVFEPESGYQIEGGIKYNLSNKLQLNLSAYSIQKENIIVNAGKNTSGKYQFTQIGKVGSKGIEFDVAYMPIAGLNIMAGYGFVEAKFEKNNTDKFGKFANAGKTFPNLPQHQAHSWVNYTVQKGFLKNMSINAGVRYSGKTISSIYENSGIDMPSYTLVDTGLGYTFSKMYFNLKLNNLLNTEYFPFSTGSSQLLPGTERNFLFTVGIKL